MAVIHIVFQKYLSSHVVFNLGRSLVHYVRQASPKALLDLADGVCALAKQLEPKLGDYKKVLDPPPSQSKNLTQTEEIADANRQLQSQLKSLLIPPERNVSPSREWIEQNLSRYRHHPFHFHIDSNRVQPDSNECIPASEFSSLEATAKSLAEFIVKNYDKLLRTLIRREHAENGVTNLYYRDTNGDEHLISQKKNTSGASGSIDLKIDCHEVQSIDWEKFDNKDEFLILLESLFVDPNGLG